MSSAITSNGYAPKLLARETHTVRVAQNGHIFWFTGAYFRIFDTVVAIS